jgi:hypothetical protein
LARLLVRNLVIQASPKSWFKDLVRGVGSESSFNELVHQAGSKTGQEEQGNNHQTSPDIMRPFCGNVPDGLLLTAHRKREHGVAFAAPGSKRTSQIEQDGKL